MSACECKADATTGAIWCQRHRVRKNAHWRHLCETSAEYFEAWEHGRGPGQAQPASPRDVVSRPNELTPSAFFCPHRKERLSDVASDVCGNRGRPAAVYRCDIHDRCTIGKRHSRITACIACSDLPAAPQHVPIAAGSVDPHRWEGELERKPWEYRITAAIPVWETLDLVPLVLGLLRLQTEPPYIVLIDTGSSDETLRALESFRAPDCEVHSLRFHGVRHPSELPAVAMDLAFSTCRTPYLFATHTDCFPRRRDLLQWLRDLCASYRVAGYEISPRDHEDWHGMVGHTCTMFDIAAMDRINAGWSLRRLCTQRGVPTVAPDPEWPNWPDTELLINYQMRDAGLKPHLIGHEQNFVRTCDQNIDHVRSITCGRMLSAGYVQRAKPSLDAAVLEANQRIDEWMAEPR